MGSEMCIRDRAMDDQTATASTETVTLPTEFNIGDWVLGVEDLPLSDQDRRKNERLQKLRAKVEARF